LPEIISNKENADGTCQAVQWKKALLVFSVR